MFVMKRNLIYSNLFSLGSSANYASNSNKIWETPPEAVGVWTSWKRAISSMRGNGWGA